MKYELINKSSTFRANTLKKLISFCGRGFGPYLDKPIIIEVADNYTEEQNGLKVLIDKTWGGVAYGNEKILIFISPEVKYPFMMESYWTPKTRYIDGQFIKDKKELFAFLVTHELLHLVQANLTLPIIASDIINIDEESQNDIIAMIKLNSWRRLQEKKKKV